MQPRGPGHLVSPKLDLQARAPGTLLLSPGPSLKWGQALTADLLGEETDVLLACKPTVNYKVQFGVSLVNYKAAGRHGLASPPWWGYLRERLLSELAGAGSPFFFSLSPSSNSLSSRTPFLSLESRTHAMLTSPYPTSSQSREPGGVGDRRGGGEFPSFKMIGTFFSVLKKKKKKHVSNWPRSPVNSLLRIAAGRPPRQLRSHFRTPS